MKLDRDQWLYAVVKACADFAEDSSDPQVSHYPGPLFNLECSTAHGRRKCLRWMRRAARLGLVKRDFHGSLVFAEVTEKGYRFLRSWDGWPTPF